MKLLIVLTLVIFSSCSHMKEWYHDVSEPESKFKEVPLNHQALIKQRLIPRPGYKGLTNQICKKFYGNECVERSVLEYLLEDVNIRNTLNQFKFACWMGTTRYRICKDQPGFCHADGNKVCAKWKKKHPFTRKKYCYKWKMQKVVKYIPITKYQLLLDGAIECQAGY